MPLALSQLLYLSIRGNVDRMPGGATVARVDAFDIILIVISVYARKPHHKVAQWQRV